MIWCLAPERPAVSCSDWLGLIGDKGMDRIRERKLQIMIFGAETVNLQSRNRVGVSPNNDAHVSTGGGGAHTVGDWVRHMRWIVRHKIYAVAAAPALTDGTQLIEGRDYAGINCLLGSAFQGAANNGHLA
jgi:hypothetical protein